MTSPLDQDAALLRAGGMAALLIRQKERIVAAFVERVRQELRDAREESTPMIIDTLPAMLTQIARTLTSTDFGEFASERSNIAIQHGDERAKLTGYPLSAVIREYQILRETIVRFLADEPEANAAGWAIIHRSIDEAIAESASAFVQVHDRFREMFIAALTHDFRGPLGNAHNYLEVLRRAPDSSQREYLATRAMNNLRRIDRMIVELLDVTRRRAGERLPVEPQLTEATALVGEVLEELQRHSGARFELDAPQKIEVHWGRERMKQAVHNLLENAVKYGARDSPITARIALAHERVSISVHNRGDPIPRADITGLFKPFQRTATAERSGKTGWGLGLVLVQSIAEAHGGTVVVESSAELGTIFTLDVLRDVRDFAPRAGTREER